QIIRTPQIVLLLKDVGPDGTDEFQICALRAQGREVDRHATSEPVRFGLVLGECAGLNRIRLFLEAWNRIVKRTVGPRTQVDRARLVRQEVAAAREIIAVVVPAAGMERAVEHAADMDVEFRSQSLVDIDAESLASEAGVVFDPLVLLPGPRHVVARGSTAAADVTDELV